jgi:hypothetical protein
MLSKKQAKALYNFLISRINKNYNAFACFFENIIDLFYLLLDPLFC